MMKSSMAYTATLLKYVSDLTGLKLDAVVSQLGVDAIGRLIHNAPMNRLLPIRKIATEIIQYYYLPQRMLSFAEPDEAFGEDVASRCIIKKGNERDQGSCLVVALANIK